MDKKHPSDRNPMLMQAAAQAAAVFLQMLPVMLGTLLLTSLIVPFVPRLFETGPFVLNILLFSLLNGIVMARVNTVTPGP